MDSSIVLVYVGDRDGQRRYMTNYPSTDITNEQLIEMARQEGKTPAEMQLFLQSQGLWELPEVAESATIGAGQAGEDSEVIERDRESFRGEVVETAGEAASDKRRRRES